MEHLFEASVQYNDLKGSSAADVSDIGKPSKWLRDKGLLNDGEHLLGIELLVGENHGEHSDPVYVRFLAFKLDGYSNIPDQIKNTDGAISVRKIDVQMNLMEFFGLFKRFGVKFSFGAALEGRKIIYTE